MERSDALAMVAPAKFLSYPCLIMGVSKIRPTAAVVAGPEPDNAPPEHAGHHRHHGQAARGLAHQQFEKVRNGGRQPGPFQNNPGQNKKGNGQQRKRGDAGGEVDAQHVDAQIENGRWSPPRQRPGRCRWARPGPSGPGRSDDDQRIPSSPSSGMPAKRVRGAAVDAAENEHGQNRHARIVDPYRNAEGRRWWPGTG